MSHAEFGACIPPKELFSRFVIRYQVQVACVLVALSLFVTTAEIGKPTQGDVRLYQSVAEDLLDGKFPYRDRELEYPPYAIGIFLLPRLFAHSEYPAVFEWLALSAHCVIILLLAASCAQRDAGLRAFLPALLYCCAAPFLRFVFLQRFDIWPALFCVLACWLFWLRRLDLCGLCIAIAIGVKLYPAVFVPPLFVLSLRQRMARRFLGGLFVGLLPIAILTYKLPWWRFAQFQGSRGLQCESVYSSVLWLFNELNLVQVKWVFVKAWFELQGTLPLRVLPWARLLFVFSVLLSMTVSSLIAAQWAKPSLSKLARLLLVPLLAFVGFNQVFSPQYMIWILPLVALASLEGPMLPPILCVGAVMLTPAIYPSLYGDYHSGLCLLETVILLVRNLFLLLGWVLFVIELIPRGKQTGGNSKRVGSGNSAAFVEHQSVRV